MEEYKLWLDKPTSFKCNIQLEGASLKNARARLVLHKNHSILYEGTIDTAGNCKIDIPKLNHLLEENDEGKMELEIIADGSYFSPWESKYIAKLSKKIQVEVVSSDETVLAEAKPTIKVKVSNPMEDNKKKIIKESVNVLTKNKITKKNVLKNKDKAVEYIVEVCELIDASVKPASVMSDIINLLK